MGLEVCPMVWPIGDGDDFKGVFDRDTRQVYLYTRQARTEKAVRPPPVLSMRPSRVACVI
jgi:peptide chain release factor 3